MKYTILQSSLIFGFLYALSIIFFPSLDLFVEGASSKLNYSSGFRLLIFSIIAFIYYLMKSNALKIKNEIKMVLVLLCIAVVLLVDFISWYFIGLYEYKGISNFIFMYLVTLPIIGGIGFFVSIFIAEKIWSKVKTH